MLSNNLLHDSFVFWFRRLLLHRRLELLEYGGGAVEQVPSMLKVIY